jgi:hypothetical protein
VTLPVQPSIEQEIADLKAAVRALRATNQTDRISVINAAGDAVPLSQLAFGMVAAEYPDFVNMTGTANTTVENTSTWRADNPNLDVLVSGSRLRVDISGTLFASGNHCSMWMAYALFYRGSAAQRNSVKTQVAGPDDVAPISVQDQTAVGAIISCGGFNLHTGLTPGWYTVEARYAIGYSNSTTAPFANVEGPRMAATPY